MKITDENHKKFCAKFYKACVKEIIDDYSSNMKFDNGANYISSNCSSGSYGCEKRQTFSSLTILQDII
ncbi:unnamed protein product [Acanthoscelides obtectus]|uniref:Uncharacterized protein n=1 Tax=Acanthoscelides obtectus TaxID=200917 RepID=A0A9P0P9R3_ACAOB|nr:unnamed protein product [Acanthoscelides obtectus]CAK1656520.1 hypothetical protein AOBTE_LOCUS19762 [Acanthoscelides obtectus]